MVRSLVEVATNETIPRSAGSPLPGLAADRVQEYHAVELCHGVDQGRAAAGKANVERRFGQLAAVQAPSGTPVPYLQQSCRRWRERRTAASRLPSGCRAMRSTRCTPRRRCWTMPPLVRSQTRTAPSSPAENSSRRCGSYSRSVITPACPLLTSGPGAAPAGMPAAVSSAHAQAASSSRAAETGRLSTTAQLPACEEQDVAERGGDGQE